MKALAILFRLVFSILVLIAIACYLQVSPTVSLSNFCSSIDTAGLLDQLCGVNCLTISLALVVLLSIFSITRLLDAIWNMLFCASILVLLAGGLYTLCGPGIALPNAIYQNEAVNQMCQGILNYEVPLAIVMLIFVAGWICASACGRVAITAVISYGLWYGVTEFFTYATHLWANSSVPSLPEALAMIQSTPWILAAVPGAFFLIYALLMAFFETYLSNNRKKKAATAAKAEEKKPESEPEAAKAAEKAASQPVAESKKDEKPVLKPVEPATKTQPLLKTASGAPVPPKKLKLATPAPAEKPAPKTEEKPAPAEKTETAPKAEEKQPAEAKAAEEEKVADTEKNTPVVEKKEETPTAESEKPAEETKEAPQAKE